MRTFFMAAAGLALAVPAAATAADSPPPAAASVPLLYSAALPEAPGSHLVVVRLTLPPAKDAQPHPHRHPGSVYVYVTHGMARLGVEGQPVQVVHAGESFFEPKGALHVVSESASQTEPATAIAVMIVPDGAPLAIPADPEAGR